MIDTIKQCPCCQKWKHIRNFNKVYSNGMQSTLKRICAICQYNSKQQGKSISMGKIFFTYEKEGCMGKTAISLGVPYIAIKEALELMGVDISHKSDIKLRNWNSLSFAEQWKIVTRMKNQQLK